MIKLECMKDINTTERIRGAFLGLYFGSGVNPRFSPMLTSEKAREMFGDKEFGEYDDYEIYKPQHTLYDQHTMTKIVYEILIKYDKITPEIFKEYLLELHKKHNVFEGDVYGPSTQRAVKKILAGEDLYEMGKSGITCGSAMRALPIAMYFHDNYDKLIENTVGSSIISHNTDVAIDAAIASNVTLASLINGKEKIKAIKDGIKASKENHGKFGKKTDEPKIYERIQDALNHLEGEDIEKAMYYIPENIGIKWFARQTIPRAFANYIVSKTPQQSSLLAMRCGGDNQTVPEIACSFLGAEKGSNIFPEEIIKSIEEVNDVDVYGMTENLIKEINI